MPELASGQTLLYRNDGSVINDQCTTSKLLSYSLFYPSGSSIIRLSQYNTDNTGNQASSNQAKYMLTADESASTVSPRAATKIPTLFDIACLREVVNTAKQPEDLQAWQNIPPGLYEHLFQLRVYCPILYICTYFRSRCSPNFGVVP